MKISAKEFAAEMKNVVGQNAELSYVQGVAVFDMDVGGLAVVSAVVSSGFAPCTELNFHKFDDGEYADLKQDFANGKGLWL